MVDVVLLERTRGYDANAYEEKERGGHAKDEGLVTHGVPSCG